MSLATDQPLGPIRGRTPKAKRERSARDAQIVLLAQSGLSPAEIAERYTTMTAHNVARVLHLARQDGIAIPRFNSSGEPVDARRSPRAHLWLPEPLATALQPAASARGISISTLMRRVAEALVEGRGLVDAVLDDGIRTPED